VNDDRDTASVHERWAFLRFAIIGPLLAAPPEKGELQAALEELASRAWKHPITGADVRFGVSTIQRWYYLALKQRRDPVGGLRRKVRRDLGHQQSLSEAVRQALCEQYGLHTGWSVALHYLNVKALAEKRTALGEVPSYSTVRRFFQAQGLRKRRRLSARRTEGVARAEERLANREVRSWEATHVGSVWHFDGHKGSLQVLTPRGEYETPILIGVIDDRSRLVCHMQYYLGAERAEIIAHALSQAFMKRGLAGSCYHDNGPAMVAEEIQDGLRRLSIADARTLPESPYMNAKIEVFWASVEGQLMAMLENVKDLTLDALNEATQAWCEYQYNREKHSETGEPPLQRFLAGPDVHRPSPDSAAIRLAFTRTERRTQRLSDGTVVVEARRFEVPNRYRHLKRLLVRYAHWDLSLVHLVDEHTGQVLCRLFPQDKTANARGVRRPLEPVATRQRMALLSNPAIPPLLSKLLQQQADTGLPPPYLSLEDEGSDGPGDEHPRGSRGRS
jgi:putative transposase